MAEEELKNGRHGNGHFGCRFKSVQFLNCFEKLWKHSNNHLRINKLFHVIFIMQMRVGREHVRSVVKHLTAVGARSIMGGFETKFACFFATTPMNHLDNFVPET